MPEAIVHEYRAQNPTEQEKLDALAAARCQVKPRNITWQTGTGAITIIFLKSATIQKAVIEILDHTGNTQDIKTLDKPMQELELGNLAEVGEVDAPYVRPTLSKEDAISRLEANNCRVNSNVSNSVLWVYNMNHDKKIVITLKSGKQITLNPGDHTDNLIGTDIVDVHWNYT